MEILIRLIRMLRPYWPAAGGALLCTLAGTAVGLIPPKLIRLIIDTGIGEGQRQLIAPLSGAIVAVAAVRGLMIWGQICLMEAGAQGVIFDLRNRLYQHIQRLHCGFFDAWPTGQLMSRATSDVDSLRRFLQFAAIIIVSATLTFTGVLIVCLLEHWRLTLLCLCVIPLMAYASYRYAGLVQPVYAAIQQKIGEVTTVLQENIGGMRLVQAYCQQQREIEKLRQRAAELAHESIKQAKLSAFFFPLMDFIFACSAAIILWYGGRLVIYGPLTLGQFIAFNAYLMLLMWPVQMAGFCVSMSQSAVASGRRIFEILDTAPEVAEKADAIALDGVPGGIRFRRVSFGYGDGQVLRGIDLDIEPGETIALMGLTGSGKSSLIHLIPRFYDPDEGCITIDGKDLRDLIVSSLRSQVGLVPQDPYLFSASIRDNIALGRPEATDEEVREAARLAALADFVEGLPEGYDTEVGERGVTLSGGQRQRMAIARALLTNPRILLLDDCTSSVDAHTEQQIHATLRQFGQGRTTIIVAQRLSTVRSADRIVVLEGRRIAEAGTHEELLERGGPYARMCEIQLVA